MQKCIESLADLDEVNDEGVAYYDDLIDELLDNGITPVVTLYHWDLPYYLHDSNLGWLNTAEAPGWFEKYARVCFELFGDRVSRQMLTVTGLDVLFQVKQWITFNEPWVTATQAYGTGEKAPGIHQPGIGDYIAAHNQIRAHARAYRLYHSEFAETQKGQVGITLNCDWFEPQDPDNEAHIEASETMLQFWFGWFATPILLTGKYPEIMREKAICNL